MKRISRPLRGRTRAVVVLALTTLAVGLTVGPALADTGFPPHITGTTTTDPTTEQTGHQGGSATVVADPPPGGSQWAYETVVFTPPQTSAQTVYGNVSCPARPVAGDADWFATGAVIKVATIDGAIGAGSDRFGKRTVTCNYPPSPRDSLMRCSVAVDGVISQQRGPGSVRTLFNQRQPSSWTSDWTNAVKCRQSMTLTADAALTQLGGYALTVTGETQDCTMRSYPGTNRASQIVRCAGITSTSRSYFGALWCDDNLGAEWDFSSDPALMDAHSAGYTFNTCAQAISGPTSCNFSQAMTLDGMPGARWEVLDDGKLHTVQWDPFRPGSAFSNVHNVATSLVLGPTHNASPDPANPRNSISPYRVGQNPGAPTQPWWVKGVSQWSDGNPASSASRAGDVTAWQIAFEEAGYPNRPFQIARRVTFDADVSVQTLIITTINFNTGQVGTSTTTVQIPATGIGCQGPIAAIDVVRARTSN